MYEPKEDKIFLGNVNGKQFCNFFEIFGGVNLLFSELWFIWIKVALLTEWDIFTYRRSATGCFSSQQL